MVLNTPLYNVVLTFEIIDKIIQLKATVHAVLSCSAASVVLHKVVLPVESVDEISKCRHSTKTIEQCFHAVPFAFQFLLK